MADPAHKLTDSERLDGDVVTAASARAHQPVAAAGRSEAVYADPWPAIRAVGATDRGRVLSESWRWHLLDQPCGPGCDSCDGGEPVSRCLVHEQTPNVAELAADVHQIVVALLTREKVDGVLATRLVDDAFAAVRRSLVIDGRIEEP